VSVSPITRGKHRERREQVKAAVRDATFRLVASGSSFKDLTVDEIAREAGITRSAFYFYFSDKREMLVSAADEVVGALYEQADRWWHGEGPPDERVLAALEGVVSVYARNSALLRVVTEVSGYDEEIGAFWRDLVERFIAATADHLRREQEAGRACSLDAARTAEQLVWMVERCCFIYLPSGERTPRELARLLCETWVAVLYPPPKAGPVDKPRQHVPRRRSMRSAMPERTQEACHIDPCTRALLWS
jgi:TetR/AcrR family transcriptional regulator, ethionamide resistance regulator